MTDRENLLNLAPDEAHARVAVALAELGQPAYRVGQVMRRLWEIPAASFNDMTDLPAALRAALADRFELPRLELAVRQLSTDGTQKFLFRLHDGEAIETVAPDESHTYTVSYTTVLAVLARLAHELGSPEGSPGQLALAIAQVRHLLGRRSEAGFLAEVARDWGHLFPHLPHQSEANRRIRWLRGAFEQLRCHLATQLPADDCQQIDTTALPVKHTSRVRGPDSWTGPDGLHARFGRDAAHA